MSTERREDFMDSIENDPIDKLFANWNVFGDESPSSESYVSSPSPLSPTSVLENSPSPFIKHQELTKALNEHGLFPAGGPAFIPVQDYTGEREWMDAQPDLILNSGNGYVCLGKNHVLKVALNSPDADNIEYEALVCERLARVAPKSKFFTKHHGIRALNMPTFDLNVNDKDDIMHTLQGKVDMRPALGLKKASNQSTLKPQWSLLTDRVQNCVPLHDIVKICRITKNIPRIRHTLEKKLMALFNEMAILGIDHGYSHGDLHTGNVLWQLPQVDLSDPNNSVLPTDEDHVYLIDYGRSFILSHDEDMRSEAFSNKIMQQAPAMFNMTANLARSMFVKQCPPIYKSDGEHHNAWVIRALGVALEIGGMIMLLRRYLPDIFTQPELYYKGQASQDVMDDLNVIQRMAGMTVMHHNSQFPSFNLSTFLTLDPDNDKNTPLKKIAFVYQLAVIFLQASNPGSRTAMFYPNGCMWMPTAYHYVMQKVLQTANMGGGPHQRMKKCKRVQLVPKKCKGKKQVMKGGNTEDVTKLLKASLKMNGYVRSIAIKSYHRDAMNQIVGKPQDHAIDIPEAHTNVEIPDWLTKAEEIKARAQVEQKAWRMNVPSLTPFKLPLAHSLGASAAGGNSTARADMV